MVAFPMGLLLIGAIVLGAVVLLAVGVAVAIGMSGSRRDRD